MSPVRATLGEAPFTIDDLDALASGSARLTLSDSARALVAESRAVVERYAVGDEPVYGLNTASAPTSAFASRARTSRTSRSSSFAVACSAWGSRSPSASVALR